MKLISQKFSFEKQPKKDYLCIDVAECVTSLMNASTSLHKLHLKVTGQGSYAAHKALQDYDKFHDFSDQLAESFQGAKGEILSYIERAPTTLNTTSEAISYLKQLKQSVNSLQSKLPYSEIVNDLDLVKSAINSILYKLQFLS